MIADKNPFKQGKFMPGSRIPIVAPEHFSDLRPDRVLALAWNIIPEIRRELAESGFRREQVVTRLDLDPRNRGDRDS